MSFRCRSLFFLFVFGCVLVFALRGGVVHVLCVFSLAGSSCLSGLFGAFTVRVWGWVALSFVCPLLCAAWSGFILFLFGWSSSQSVSPRARFVCAVH